MGQAATKAGRRLPTEVARAERVKEAQAAAQTVRAAQHKEDVHRKEQQHKQELQQKKEQEEKQSAHASQQESQQQQQQQQQQQGARHAATDTEGEPSFLDVVKRLHVQSHDAPEAEYQQRPRTDHPEQEHQPAAHQQAEEHRRQHEEAMIKSGHEERTGPNQHSLRKETAADIQQRHVDELLEQVEGKLNFKQMRALMAMHQHDPDKFTPKVLASKVKVGEERLSKLFQHTYLPDELVIALGKQKQQQQQQQQQQQ